MTHMHKALILAAAMIGAALLATAGIIPEIVAQWTPLALVALCPSVWMGKNTCCKAAS